MDLCRCAGRLMNPNVKRMNGFPSVSQAVSVQLLMPWLHLLSHLKKLIHK